jgi:hypothetical protein
MIGIIFGVILGFFIVVSFIFIIKMHNRNNRLEQRIEDIASCVLEAKDEDRH